jgi:signal transduction histidine kinase
MRFSWSLQSRFLVATSVLTLVLCTAFGVAVHLCVDLLEYELLHHSLVREMQELKSQVATDPYARPPSAAGLSGFIVRNATDQAALPAELVPLARGIYQDVIIKGRTYDTDVDGVGNTRLYVLLNTEHVEFIEGTVVTIAFIIGLVALGLSAVIAIALSREVMRPVTELAADVARLDPTRRSERLRNRFANREVGIIAAAFDDYMERLERVLEREQAFTEDASHEFRTPLAIISSATELLSEEPALSDAARERVNRIRRAVGQMQSLIEALLYLARGDQGGAPQPCALDQIVREAVDVIAVGAAAKSLAVNVEVEPVTVAGAPIMMACVVNNLLLNAVNFTQQGGIDVKLTRDELVVRDTGIGIPPEDLSRIFERRYRGAQSRGLGLGLYLVSRICQKLGWKIETRSAPGVGTTFRVELPQVAALAAGGGVG